MVHFLEPLNTNQAYIAPPIFFGTNVFYLSFFFCMIINEKIVDNNKVLSFQLPLFIFCALLVRSSLGTELGVLSRGGGGAKTKFFFLKIQTSIHLV